MAKKRIADIAEKHGLNAKDLSKQLQEAGFSVPSPNSTIDEKLALSVVKANEPTNGANHPQRIGDLPPEQQRAPPRRVPPVRRTGPARQRAVGPACRRSALRRPRRSRPRRSGPRPGGRGPSGPTGSGAGTRAPGASGGGGARWRRRRRPGRLWRARRATTSAPASALPARPAGAAASSSTRRPRAAAPAARAAPAVPAAARRAVRRARAAGAVAEPTTTPSQPLDVKAQGAIDKVKVNSGSTVKDVAEYFGVPVPDLIKKLMTLGEMATLTQTLSDDAIQVLADEFDREIEIVHAADDVDVEPTYEDDEADLVERPPVVTIMGHVDHGKTSLLDAIRDTSVTAGEAGGITQHIGAYQVHHNDKAITFLDTPGHQAFTAMRARGASVTDIVVLVVAADDGVKPQTEEAIDHARAAGVPIVVAVNKIDKEGADPTRVRTELTQRDLQPAEWGGETEYVDVSAKTKQNLEDLLETIQVVTDLQELKANPDTDASGHVIESKLDPGRGPVVTVLIDRGTLEIGDALVAGLGVGQGPRDGRLHRRPREGGRPRRSGRGARLRRRPRGRRVRARGRERPPRTRPGRRARQPPQDRGDRPPLGPQGVPGGRLRPRQAGRVQGAGAGHQGRRRRLAGGAGGRDRQAAPDRGLRPGHPPRRGRHQRVRHHARRPRRRRS